MVWYIKPVGCLNSQDVPMVARQQALECLCIEDRVHMATNMVAERREALLVTSRVRVGTHPTGIVLSS